MPVPDENDVVLGIDPNRIRAVADCRKTRRRRARPLFLFGVEPPEIAVVWTVLTRRNGVAEPLIRDELLVAPLASIEREQSESREIFGVDPEAAAPPRTAAHRSNFLAADLDLRVVVWNPAPFLRRADR